MEDFVLRAIEKLRTEKSKGIHVVFSGFNGAFRQYYPDLDPRKECEKLAKDKVIMIVPCKGGARIYLASDAPAAASQEAQGAKALSQIMDD